jgi:5-methylcytosine-specific restriction endonuclease McrA
VTGRPRWGGRQSRALRLRVLARDYDPALGYSPCVWCGRPATTADHWPIARVDGGADTMENLRSACFPCNASRGAVLALERRRPPPPSRRW